MNIKFRQCFVYVASGNCKSIRVTCFNFYGNDENAVINRQSRLQHGCKSFLVTVVFLKKIGVRKITTGNPKYRIIGYITRASVGSTIARSRACEMCSLLVKTAIRGYHVYRVVWEPRVGESFVVLHESGNDNDRHAMAVYRDEDP